MLRDIAASGHPDTPELFRKIMIASAAVPMAFPLVDLAVQADDRHYDEMHVNGGVTHQVFLYSPVLEPPKKNQETR